MEIMKRAFFVLCFLIAAGNLVNAQELGIRVGNVSGGHYAVDAMFGLGQFSRIHADVSFGDGGVGIDALWDFLYKPLGNEAFNWYLGAGPYSVIDDPFWLGVAAEAGLEYRFNSVPIALGIDYRPRFSIIEETEFYWGGFGFNARFVFGQK